MLNGIKDKVAGVALDQIKERLINPKIADIARITKVSIESGKLYLIFVLKGLEDREMQVQCGAVSIAEDGSTVTLGNYTSNMAFLENALNQFAAKTFPVPDTAFVRTTLKTVKALLGV